ncbi:DNA cytosine methyltransferase [Arthrobacter sp. NtRootA1]|uniref:DNA cytosine methyltransferase n=1 Tax=Arthrobacter sp. NtRootA1 TaxID=2830983 RepID=UPI001CC48A77|nr:DNA cytosine methyltransferase [Arthrobacter sp. NtRootA1]BCW04948.1 cytosine-specific methyltransferase [Arthrobacter sp. NtRootA1]
MKYVDLFSGCGGLSLGLERAGAELILAVEKSDMAARTFYHNLVGDMSDSRAWQNYLGLSEHEQVKSRVFVNELGVLLSNDDAMTELASEGLDFVVGGPPCQGFSLAGRRNPEDVRNRLPWQFLDFVERTRPRAVVIENVVGMGRRFNTEEESSFNQLRTALAETEPGYVVQAMQVNAVHYGAPQHRPRLLIVGLRDDIASSVQIEATSSIWKSNFTDLMDDAVPALVPVPILKSREVRTVGDAIADLNFLGNSGLTQNHEEYIKIMSDDRWGLSRKANGDKLNHIRRRHNERTISRFRLYQYLAVQGLNPRILSQTVECDELEARRRIELQLQDADFPAYAPDGTHLAENLQHMVQLVLRLRTKKHSQRVLAWAEPARTVVTLPDDYVHPLDPRVFSVRELARFQGFPDDFEFLGKETTGAHRRRIEVPQYSQVGNAVSPHLSWAIGKMLRGILDTVEPSFDSFEYVNGDNLVGSIA